MKGLEGIITGSVPAFFEIHTLLAVPSWQGASGWTRTIRHPARFGQSVPCRSDLPFPEPSVCRCMTGCWLERHTQPASQAWAASSFTASGRHGLSYLGDEQTPSLPVRASGFLNLPFSLATFHQSLHICPLFLQCRKKGGMHISICKPLAHQVWELVKVTTGRTSESLFLCIFCGRTESCDHNDSDINNDGSL